MSLDSGEGKVGQTKIDPFGATLIRNYDRLYEEFGIQPFTPLLSEVPNPTAAMRIGVIFGHRDFQHILKAMKDKENFAVTSGIKPDGEFHLGSMMTAQEIICFQRQGADAFYFIADVEAYEDNGTPLKRAKE